MSILIKGMEMPKEMRTLTIFPNGYVAVYNSFDTFVSETKAIQIPPHGRLIDADALDDAFTDLRWENGDYKSGALIHWGDRPHWCLTGSEVENLINAAPTIIPADKEG